MPLKNLFSTTAQVGGGGVSFPIVLFPQDSQSKRHLILDINHTLPVSSGVDMFDMFCENTNKIISCFCEKAYENVKISLFAKTNFLVKKQKTWYFPKQIFDDNTKFSFSHNSEKAFSSKPGGDEEEALKCEFCRKRRKYFKK